jgi:heme/copper-type cytochrome/quinol oxidase subunit 4
MRHDSCHFGKSFILAGSFLEIALAMSLAMFLSRHSWDDNAMNVTLLFGGVFAIIIVIGVMMLNKKIEEIR